MDDLNSFGLEIERECLITTMQTMIETHGSEATIRLLRPYLELSGIAFALNLSEWTKNDDTILRLAKTIIIGQLPMGQKCKAFYIKEGEAFFESEGCPFIGTLPEICECYCEIMGGAFTKQINPDLEIELTPGSGKEDPRCRWRFYYRTPTLLSGFSNRDLDIDTIINQISEEELRWRSHHYIGGVWYMVTYALMNNLDSKVVLERLSDSMRRNGLSFGLRIMKYNEIEGRDLDSVFNALNVFSKAVFQKQVPLNIKPEELEVHVEECMWSLGDYATPEHCHLIESINDGICASINPDFEFRYKSLKPKGADKCVWTVKKKSTKQKSREVETGTESSEQDLIALLKARLARGEISLEQYEKIAQILKN